MRITVSDVYENLDHQEVPEEVNAIIIGDFFNFSRLKEGDKIKLIVVPEFIEIPNKNKNLGNVQEKLLRCVGIDELEQNYFNNFITQDDEKEFNKIKKNPLKYFKDVLFSDLHDVELGCDLSIIALFGKLHLLYLGNVGSGKSEIQKRIIYISLRGDFVNVIEASQAGMRGGITPNPFTGKYSL